MTLYIMFKIKGNCQAFYERFMRVLIDDTGVIGRDIDTLDFYSFQFYT